MVDNTAAQMIVGWTDSTKVQEEGTQFTVVNKRRTHGDGASGTVAVSDGAWYFEVRCTKGCPLIGWAPVGEHKALKSSQDSYYCDMRRGYVGNCGRTTRFGGENFNSGDIVGSLIDFRSRCVSFTHNGAAITQQLRLGSKLAGEGYAPVIELEAGQACVVSLEASDMCAAVDAGVQAYAVAVLAKLGGPGSPRECMEKLFDQFADEPGSNRCTDEKLQELFTAVGSTSDTDPLSLVALWFFSGSTPAWEVVRDRFVERTAELGCRTVDDVKRVMQAKTKEALDRKRSWDPFYKFVFRLMAGRERFLGAEGAVEAWKLFGFQKWRFYDDWARFLAQKEAEQHGSGDSAGVVDYDAWDQLPLFMKMYPTTFEKYDPFEESWNSLFDEFVEAMSSKGDAK